MTKTFAPTKTQMAQETAEAPARVGDMLAANRDAVAALSAKLRQNPPRLLMTCARGSSDHAATYLQYLSLLKLGIPASSLPPSIASVYQAEVDLEGVLFVLISQSGQSPDLVAGAKWAASHGAHVVAMVNVADSPVAQAAHDVLPLMAGPEISVAATKSYLTALASAAQLVAGISGDAGFAHAVDQLPKVLQAAARLDWSAAVDDLAESSSVFVAGRGPGLAAAFEMALKLKETSAMHAEAFSSAEIMHGPLGLLQPGMPVLLLGQNDQTLPGVKQLDASLRQKGARVYSAYEGAFGNGVLPVVPGVDPALAPLAAVQSFYSMASELAVRRGFDPDKPEHLKKVTETR